MPRWVIFRIQREDLGLIGAEISLSPRITTFSFSPLVTANGQEVEFLVRDVTKAQVERMLDRVDVKCSEIKETTGGELPGIPDS